MTDLLGPTVPTPKTPVSMSIVDDGLQPFEEGMKSPQEVKTTHHHGLSSFKPSHSSTRAFNNFILRSLPAFVLTLTPAFLIYTGFYSPAYFFSFTILYNLYTLYILTYILYFGFIAWGNLRKNKSINFYQKYLMKQKAIMKASSALKSVGSSTGPTASYDETTSSSEDDEDERNSRFTHRRRNSKSGENKSERTDDQWNKVVHFVIIPNYNERESILRQSLNSLAQQSIARRQIIPVLAMEAREQGGEAKAKRLVSDYGLQFKDIIYSLHPSGVPDETPGKGSNSNYAFQKGIREYVESSSVSEIDPNYIVVTVQDADSIYHENHFDSLTYSFLVSHMYGTQNLSIWQAPMVCYRNFNEVPAMSRALAYLVTLHEFAALNDDSFENISFSTYSTSFQFLLHGMNGWCPKYITEDWHFTIRAFFNSGCMTRVYSLPFPISCYSTQAETYWGTIYERIVQAKRHTLVFTEFPYFFKRIILAMTHGTTVPPYVQPNYHLLGAKVDSNSDDLEEGNRPMPSVNWWRLIKLFWNVSSVNYIGGTQLMVVILSVFFSQYYGYIYNPDTVTTEDPTYWVYNLWTPLLTFTNLLMFFAIPAVLFLNDKLIAYVNGREYQSKWMVLRHWAEWWIFSPIANALLVIGPTYHSAFEMIFKDRYVFERSTKPEAPHLFRKKKTAQQSAASRERNW